MFEQDLKKLGFSSNLAKIYLKLIEMGKVKASEIINQTSLQRSVVYSALEELAERELVSKIEVRGVATFSANDPAFLVEETKNKTELAKKLANELKDRQVDIPREVIVAEGMDAIMRATDRSLLAAPGETMYVLGASKNNVQPTLSAHWKVYHKQRVKKNINFRVLFDRTAPQEEVDYRNSIPYSEARYLPPGLEMPVWFNICADIVSIMVPVEDPPLVFTIRSRPTADALKNYFYFFWEQGKKRK